MEMLQKKDVPIDNVITMMLIFGFTANFVPRMALKRYLPRILELGIEYIKINFANFNSYKLDIFSQFVSLIGNRLFSLSEKH